MTDSCIICETEPIDDSDWYRCEKTMEVICPWCVKDMHKMRENKKTVGTCHECGTTFQLSDDFLIEKSRIPPIWECPECDYPNSKDDLGIK